MHILAVAFAVALSAHPQHKPKIAVLDVQDVSGDQASHARTLGQIINAEVARDGSLDVITASQIRELLGYERQKELLGCNESACLAEIGGALGVDYLLTSQLGKIGSRYRLDLTLINQAKARTEAGLGEFLPSDEDSLGITTEHMVDQLLVKAHLRSADSPALDAAISTSVPVSHTGAYVAYGIAGALAVGAGVMTWVTHNNYETARYEYGGGGFTQANPGPAGKNLKWMGPLTDALWVGTAIAAGTGTILYFTAKPTGSGGEVSVGGSF